MTEYFFIFEVIEEMKSEDYSEIRTNFHFEQEVIDNVTRDFSSPYVSARVIKDGSGCIIRLYPFRFTPSLSEKNNRDYGVKLTCLGHLDDTNDCTAIIEDVWMPIKKNAKKQKLIERDKQHKRSIRRAYEEYELKHGRKPSKGEKKRINKAIAKVEYHKKNCNAVVLLGRQITDVTNPITTFSFLRDCESEDAQIMYKLSIEFADALTQKIVNEFTPESHPAAKLLLDYRAYLEKRLPLGSHN